MTYGGLHLNESYALELVCIRAVFMPYGGLFLRFQWVSTSHFSVTVRSSVDGVAEIDRAAIDTQLAADGVFR